MPQALPMVAAWAATAWTSAVTVTAGALASVGTVAAIGEGATIALASGILKTAAVTAISAAATALMRPNTPSSGTTLDFKPDPKAPVRGAMGFTAVGGNKVFQATWGYKRVAMSLGVALSLGPIQGVAAFEADGSTVAFNPANQYEALGFYDSDMWQRTTLGLPGDAALLPPTGLKYGNPGLTGWGLQNAAPQTAFAFWTMVLAKNPEDRDIFTNGVPDPRWILNGMRVWQPRFDSTYPGGSGPQRRDDWRTWGWSENPYDHALAWVRGHYKLNIDGSIDKTKRIAGVGAPDSAIDIPAFVEGANISDANGWTISGEWSTSDGKWQTLVAMLQAGGGQPINRGAQISVLVNAPRVSTYTYTRADLVGQAQIKPLTPRRDRKNTIIPRYRSQPNGWEYVAAGEVTASTYRTEDRGEQRSTEAEYVHVRDARQAGQLAAYDLVNLREGLTATLPSKVHLMSVHAGDCITVDVPELALANQKFVVMRTTTDYKSAVVTLELRSETDAKHAFALGQVGQAPPSPSLSAVDPRYIAPPVADDWSVMPQPPSGGTTQPIVIVIGKTEVGDAASIIVETGPSTTGPWSTVYAGTPLLDGRYPSPGLQPGQQYWVSVRYVAKNGAISDRLIQGPITASQLVAGDVSPNAPGLSQIRSDLEAAFGDILDVSNLISQTRTDLNAVDAALLHAIEDTNASLGAATEGLLAADAALLGAIEDTNASLGAASASLIAADEALSVAIGSVGDRAQVLEETTAGLEANKASVGALNAQVARIDGVEGVNATQALALVDLENGKVAVSEYDTLKGEVAAARDGSPSLLGQIQSLKAVDVDLQANKASVSVVENLAARTATAEAGLTTLDEAIVAEAVARSESISLQSARVDGVEAVNATQALALVDLENNKVALSEYNTLKGEVTAARDGAPSLLGQIQNLKSVDLDLETNKASVASVDALTARTSNTEADITDLENAAATDRTATAQAINQLRAQGGGFNKQRNPRWLNGWDGWPIRVGGWNYSPLAGGDASWALFGPAAAGETGLLYGEMIPWDEDKPIGLSGRRYVNSITSGVLQIYIGCYDAAGSPTGVRQVVPFFNGGYPAGQAEGAQNFVGQENQKTPAGTTQVRIQIEAVGVNAGAYLGLYYVMLSDDPRRAFTDDSTVQAIGASVTDQLLALIDLENNKASVESLNAQVVRIDGVEGVNATQALALIDLENNKVALSEYNTLKGEVTAARGEAPSLLGQIQSLKSVDLDLENNKASVASVEALTARTSNTEADITDLENALATETGARAQAVEQVRAAWRGQAINANPSFAQWPNADQLPTGWQGSGSVTREAGKVSPYCARLTGLATLLYGGADLRAVGGGAFIIEADVRRTSSTGTFADAGILLQAFDDAGNLLPDGSKGFTISTAPLDPDLNGGGAAAGAGFEGETYRLRLFCDVRYAATRRYFLSAVSLSPGLAFDVDQLALRPATNAEILAGRNLPALSASVTEQSLAIIDLENNAAIASWRVKAEASGGRPAVLEVFSSTYGSGIALGAEQVFLGDNTVIDTVSQTQQGVFGSSRRVIANGAPFGPDQLIQWVGPSNIALGAMTKANAGFWVDQVGAYGPTPLPSFWAKVTPTQISRSRTGAGSISTALNDVIVTCYTGTSGATCTWSRVSGDTTINYPSTGFTPVFNTTLAAGQTKTALFVGLVAKGGDVDLVYVNVEFSDNV